MSMLDIPDDKMPLVETQTQAGAYRSDVAPPDGAIVFVLASDDRGEYQIPFPVRFENDCWLNAATGIELSASVYIEGWRER